MWGMSVAIVIKDMRVNGEDGRLKLRRKETDMIALGKVGPPCAQVERWATRAVAFLETAKEHAYCWISKDGSEGV